MRCPDGAARWHVFGAKGPAFIVAWGNAHESVADTTKALKARFKIRSPDSNPERTLRRNHCSS